MTPQRQGNSAESDAHFLLRVAVTLGAAILAGVAAALISLNFFYSAELPWLTLLFTTFGVFLVAGPWRSMKEVHIPTRVWGALALVVTIWFNVQVVILR